jgi:hypothetical protein
MRPRANPPQTVSSPGPARRGCLGFSRHRLRPLLRRCPPALRSSHDGPPARRSVDPARALGHGPGPTGSRGGRPPQAPAVHRRGLRRGEDRPRRVQPPRGIHEPRDVRGSPLRQPAPQRPPLVDADPADPARTRERRHDRRALPRGRSGTGGCIRQAVRHPPSRGEILPRPEGVGPIDLRHDRGGAPERRRHPGDGGRRARRQDRPRPEAGPSDRGRPDDPDGDPGPVREERVERTSRPTNAGTLPTPPTSTCSGSPWSGRTSTRS